MTIGRDERTWNHDDVVDRDSDTVDRDGERADEGLAVREYEFGKGENEFADRDDEFASRDETVVVNEQDSNVGDDAAVVGDDPAVADEAVVLEDEDGADDVHADDDHADAVHAEDVHAEDVDPVAVAVDDPYVPDAEVEASPEVIAAGVEVTSPEVASSEPTSEPAGAPGAHVLSGEWQSLQGRFVDDPDAAVTEAAALVDEAIRTLLESLQHGTEGADEVTTEQKRLAFQRYRAVHETLTRA